MAKEINLREYTQQIEDYLRNARIDEAIAHASHILSVYPKNASAYRNLGRALMRQQRYEEAGEIFRRLLGAIPDDFSAHYQLSIVYEQAKQADPAIYHIERAFDQQPNNKQVNDRLRLLYKNFKNTQVDKIQLTAGTVANQYLKAGNFPQAIELLKRTLEKMPDRTDLRLLLARAYWESRQAIEAAETSVALLKSSPYVLEANRVMTDFWLEQDRPSDAQRFLSRIEELDPYLAFEIATGKDVPDEQFVLPVLDFAKYAASINAQQTPDWLDNIEVREEESPPAVEAPASNWLDSVDAAAKPPAPAKKKVTDSLEGLLPDEFDFPESAGTDDSVSDSEEDELDALLGAGTGLTGLLGTDSDSDDDDFMNNLLSGEAKPERASTGLTGMLRNLGVDDEQAEDDSWMQELSSGRYDTGDIGAKKESSVDDFFADMADDVKATNEFNPAAEIAHEEDPMSWLLADDDEAESAHAAEDTGTLTSPEPAKAYDPNDPMAWLQSGGIDFDDSVEAAKPSLFEDNEPTALPSQAHDPMAWLGSPSAEDDERHLETNEFDAAMDEVTGEDPFAWLTGESLGEAASITTDELSTGALHSEDSDPLAWMAESDRQTSGGDRQSDEDVLAELFDLAGLTDEHEAVSDDLFSETEEAMSDQSDWTPDDLPEDEDLGLEWLDEDGDELSSEAPAAMEDDSLAWLTEAGIDLDEEEEPSSTVIASSQEDPMAWLTATGTEEVDEQPQMVVPNTDDLNNLFGDESNQADDFDLFGDEESADDFDFSEISEEKTPATTGFTGMLDRLSAAEVESGEWLGELDTSDAFEHEDDMSWLNTLDGKETPEAPATDLEPVSEFASDFTQASENDSFDFAHEEESAESFDWGTVAEESGDEWGMADEEEAQALDWGTEPVASDDFGDFGEEELEAAGEDWLAELGSPAEEPIAMSDDFGDFGEEEAEPAAEMDWMTSLGDESDDFAAEPVASDDFGDFGEEEAEAAGEDWLAELGSPAEEPIAMSNDFGDFGEEEAEPAAEMDWMTSLGDESDDFAAEPVANDDFGDFGEEEAEPAAESSWLNALGDESEFSDEGSFAETSPEEAGEMAWMNAISEESGFGDEGSLAEESFADVEAEPAAEMDWMASLDETSDDFASEPLASDDFGDFVEEEAEPAAMDWMSSLGDESDDFAEPEAAAWGEIPSSGFTDELEDPEPEAAAWGEMPSSGFTDELDSEPEAAAWGEVPSSGFTDELEDPEPEVAAWGEVPSSGFTDELEDPEPEVAAWGEVPSSGFTDELDSEPEAAEMDWMTSLDDEADDFGDFEDEEEEVLPEKSTFGMTGMLNSIRATRGEELEETLGEMGEPDWLDNLEESQEEATEEELEPLQSYQPLASSPIDAIDWSDLSDSSIDEMEALPFEDSEPIEVEAIEAIEAKPLAEVLQEDRAFVTATVSEQAQSYDDSNGDTGDNAPDWLNAMVPGLDLDFEAEEDAVTEGWFTESERSLRERRISEEAQASEFGWLQDIVDEESGMMDAIDEDDYVAPAPPPMPQRQQYLFTQLPVWLREAPAAAIAMSETTEAPDYLSDFEDFDDSSEFDEFDDDFEFEEFDDDEFDK
jgi:tetratricopeptide (TPR) repeat protein